MDEMILVMWMHRKLFHVCAICAKLQFYPDDYKLGNGMPRFPALFLCNLYARKNMKGGVRHTG